MIRAMSLGLTLALGACVASGEADRVALDTEVRGFLSDFRGAFAEVDPERIRALCVTDDRFRWLEDGETRYSSVDDILAGLAALPPGGQIETEYAEPRITILSDRLASVESSYASTFGDPDAGGFSFSGMTSMLLEKGDDGWRVLSGHTSSVRASEWQG